MSSETFDGNIDKQIDLTAIQNLVVVFKLLLGCSCLIAAGCSLTCGIALFFLGSALVVPFS